MYVDERPRERQQAQIDSQREASRNGFSRSKYENVQKKQSFLSFFPDNAEKPDTPAHLTADLEQAQVKQQSTEAQQPPPHQSLKQAPQDLVQLIERNHRRVLETLLPSVLYDVMACPTLFVNITNCIYWTVNEFMDNCIKAMLTKLGVVLGVEDRKEELLDILLQFPNNLGNPEPEDLSKMSRQIQASVAEIISNGRVALIRCETRESDKSYTFEQLQIDKSGRPRCASRLHIRGALPA